MATMREVQEAMVRHWPDGLPYWLDPHGTGEPEREEYSRVTDGQRYQIVVERARAWTRACSEVLNAQVTPFASADAGRSGWTITSPRPATVALRVETIEMDFPSIRLGCGAAHGIEIFPECGCDACDPGSEPLLSSIDGWFMNALNGGLAHIWGDQWSATQHVHGASTGGAPSAPVQMEHGEARRQLAVIASGGIPQLPKGLQWVWSGHWTN